MDSLCSESGKRNNRRARHNCEFNGVKKRGRKYRIRRSANWGHIDLKEAIVKMLIHRRRGRRKIVKWPASWSQFVYVSFVFFCFCFYYFITYLPRTFNLIILHNACIIFINCQPNSNRSEDLL